MMNFEERMEFGGKESWVSNIEIGIDRAYGVGFYDLIKTSFYQCFWEQRHHILFSIFGKSYKCIVFFMWWPVSRSGTGSLGEKKSRKDKRISIEKYNKFKIFSI